MNNVVTIENTEMQIREYNGQRVVTFKDIDTVHGNKNGTSRRNFNRNKKHFIEGEDYFALTKEFSNETICHNRNSNETNSYIQNISIPNRGITVLTESGYLLIAKSFTDDLSWNVQRQLVNAYFRLKQEYELSEQPLSYPEVRPKYQTSSTPVPKNPSWYARNRRRMERLCETVNCPLSYLYHCILKRLGEEYDLDTANAIYEKELGYPPKYALDIVSYFPDLGAFASEFLTMLEKATLK